MVGTWKLIVKGVSTQDRRATTTELVALAGNGAGGFAQALYGRERGRRRRGRLGITCICLILKSADYIH